MIVNSYMKRLMDRYELSLGRTDQVPDVHLKKAIDKITEVDGCFFLASQVRDPGARLRLAKDFPDKTGLEAFINHLHIEDIILPKRVTGRILLGQGLEAMKRLKVLCSNLNGHFLIVLSFHNNSCGLRFHKIRNGEVWLAEDIEAYSDEGILALTT